MFFWDVVVVVVVVLWPCGPFCGTFTKCNSMGVFKLPIGDTPMALHSFALLHTTAEALPSFLLFPDFLPGSQVHRNYSWKIYVQCTVRSQFSEIIWDWLYCNLLMYCWAWKFCINQPVNMAQSFRSVNLTCT